jgi:hypothetical protein
MTDSTRTIAAVIAMLAGVACSGQPQSRPTAPAPTPAPERSATAPTSAASETGNPAWLAVDSAGKTVTLSLETTAAGSGPSATINGYRSGGARIVVPLGWTVKWNWRNADPASPHNLVVMTQREKIPLEGGRPAFSNAMSRMVSEGLPPGQTDQTTFVAEEAGWYWLLCGVASHALNGEWIELRVDPEAKTASVKTKA